MTDSKQPQQSPLKTRNADLTPEIIKQLEKKLGTAARPFPMFGPWREGDGSSAQVFSVIASDAFPLTIYSERPYEEVLALALCDMPVPSMLRQFKDAIERRALVETDHNRTHMIIGDPGFGKSFMAGLLGRLRSRERVEVFDCGGKKLNDLLFEMVLDFGSSNVLPDTIDNRLRDGKLHPLSVGLLKKLGATALLDAQSKPTGETLGDKIFSLDAQGNIQSVDWNYFKGNGATVDESEAAFDTLKKIAENEGIDNTKGNALGMNSQYGPLIRAFIDGREIVLDEYNKSQEGGDNALQTVLQFLNGEISSHTVPNPLKNKDSSAGPESFTFRREDTKAGFFVTLTGNRAVDGSTTRVLNKSVYSRLTPDTLAFPTDEDWQHRICQIFTGMPVSTIYEAYRDQADADPAAFGRFLLSVRQAKAKIEGATVPPLEAALLENWQAVIRASDKIGRLFNEWARLVDPDRTDADLGIEIDEEFANTNGVDFRTVMQIIKKARRIQARMEAPGSVADIDFENFLKEPVIEEVEPEDPATFLGTRFVDLLEDFIERQTAGKPELEKRVKAKFNAVGLRDIELQDASRNPDQKSVEADLNLTVFHSNNLTRQAALARKIFCDYLRSVDSEIVEQNDDAIITVDRFRRALKAVSENEKAAAGREIAYINREHETLVDQPLEQGYIEDIVPTLAAGEKYELPFGIDGIVDQEDFLASLALPVVGEKNLSMIWDNNMQTLDEDANDDVTPGDVSSEESLRIAAGTSESGVATTTLRVRFRDAAQKEDKVISLHFVANRRRGEVLVVGEALPAKLQKAFKEAGIVHVSRSEANAEQKVESALNKLLRGVDESVKKYLTSAFDYRNGVFFGDYLLNNKAAVTREQYRAAEKALAVNKQTIESQLESLTTSAFLDEKALTEAQLKRLRKAGDDLLAHKVLTDKELATARAAVVPGKDLAAVLVERKLVTEAQLADAKRKYRDQPKFGASVPDIGDLLLAQPLLTQAQVAKAQEDLQSHRTSLNLTLNTLGVETYLVEQGSLSQEACDAYKQEWSDRSFGELLLDPGIDMIFPKYVAKKRAAAGPA